MAEVAVGGAWWVSAGYCAWAHGPVWMLSISDLFRGAGVLLLAQGLLRDLGLLAIQARSRRAAAPAVAAAAPQRMRCLCVESTLGSALIGICIVLAALGMHERVGLSAAVVLGGCASLWSVGYLSRDLVLQVHREPDHRMIIGR